MKDEFKKLRHWVSDNPMLAAFLTAVLIVVLVGIAFAIHWVVGTIFVCGGVLIAILTGMFYMLFDW